jgi:peptide/nickel transport system ATP-binding protein
VERGETSKIFNNPLHPYTQMLVASVPRLDEKWDEVMSVESKSTPSGIINGCPYLDRCPYAHEKCEVMPELIEVESNHFVACWKYTN